MKASIVALLLTTAMSVHAQQVIEENGKLVYNGHEFKAGEMIQLSYGTRQDKGFAYVFFNRSNRPSSPVTSLFGGYRCEVLAWRFFKGKYYVKARPIGRHLKVQIDVVAAIDNKEVL